MQKQIRSVFSVSIVLIVIVSWGLIGLAAIRRDIADDCVGFGEWQAPRSAEGRGFFLPLDDFTPGKTLAVKIWLDQPDDTVTVKFFVETPQQSVFQFKRACQDNRSCDLSPIPEIIVLELMEIPDTPVARYIVEVHDRSDHPPIVRALESPIEPTCLTGHVRQALGETADMLWRLPQTISTSIFIAERGIEVGAPEPEPLQTLVIADTAGHPLKTSLRLQSGEISDPLWLPDQRILFVEQRDQEKWLKVLPDTLAGAPEDFSQAPTSGVEPHLTPDRQCVIFRQGPDILQANLAGATITPLIQDKQVKQILGVFPASDTKSYALVFSAQHPEIEIDELWMANIQDAAVQSISPLPYSTRWFALAAIKLFGGDILYENQESTDAGSAFGTSA